MLFHLDSLNISDPYIVPKAAFMTPGKCVLVLTI